MCCGPRDGRLGHDLATEQEVVRDKHRRECGSQTLLEEFFIRPHTSLDTHKPPTTVSFSHSCLVIRFKKRSRSGVSSFCKHLLPPFNRILGHTQRTPAPANKTCRAMNNSKGTVINVGEKPPPYRSHAGRSYSSAMHMYVLPVFPHEKDAKQLTSGKLHVCPSKPASKG